jgi:hypothetical protein
MGQQQQQDAAVLAEDVVRLNNEAIKNWLALDHVTAECLQGQSLTLLHKLCQSLARRHRHHGKKQLTNRNSIKTGQLSAKPSSIRISKVTLPSPPVVAATLQLQRSSCGGSFSGGIGRPYQKAFLLNPTLVKSGSFDQESIHLIAAVIFYNAGLFYHLGSGVGPTIGLTTTTTAGGCLLPPPPYLDPTFRSQLVRRYYRQADALLGRFMDTTRQARLWTFQAAIWHNLADNAVGLAMDSPQPSPSASSSLSTSPSTTPPPSPPSSPPPTTIVTAAAAYQTMAVWVNLSQLEAFVGWVEDAEDRSFFHYSIRLAQVLRNNN